MFDMKIFKSALSDYSKTLKKVRDEIEQTERAIEDCTFAPVSKKDVKEAFRTWIGSEATEWRRLLAERLSFATKPRAELLDPKLIGANLRQESLLTLGLPQNLRYQGTLDATALKRALIGMFEEPILKSINDALDTLPWDPAGIDSISREKTLKGLREKLKALKEQEGKLVRDAEEVGIDPSGIQ